MSAVDYVSSTTTLESAAKVLDKRGRLVTLGGAGKPLQLSSIDLLYKEQNILGESRRHSHRSQRPIADLLTNLEFNQDRRLLMLGVAKRIEGARLCRTSIGPDSNAVG